MQVYIYFCFFERNILYPLLFLSVITEDSPKVSEHYGPLWGSFIVVICGLKCLRSSYSDQSSQYMILIYTALFFKYDYKLDETFLVEYSLMSMVFHKFYELLLKVSNFCFSRHDFYNFFSHTANIYIYFWISYTDKVINLQGTKIFPKMFFY